MTYGFTNFFQIMKFRKIATSILFLQSFSVFSIKKEVEFIQANYNVVFVTVFLFYLLVFWR